jgi:cytochrome c oxidase subunit 2
MKRGMMIFPVLFCLLLSLIAGSWESTLFAQDVKRIGSPAPAGAPIKEIEMTAKKYEFSPSKINVPSNTLVRIRLTALDREHGFEITSYPGSCVTVKPGKTVSIEFYTDKKGEFEFSFCKFCGLGHGKMKGKLIVE